VSRHVLLTGFEPFGPHLVNPSELLVRSFEGRIIGGALVTIRIFPVETRTLRDRIDAALREERPEFVIGLGYAPGISALGLERIGVNVLDFEIPDSAGMLRKNEPVHPGGPDGRLSTLPLAEIASAWSALGVPGYVSDSAGTYLCNQWLYEALALTEKTAPPVPAGFIHLPALPAQAVQLGAERTPSMTLELMSRGVESAIESTGVWMQSQPAHPPRRSTDKVWIPRGLRNVER
jgi:pyroglutamyl-peptidase